MDKELYKIAYQASRDVYNNNISAGRGVEYAIRWFEWKCKLVRVISFSGSGADLWDWYNNFNLLATGGLKTTSARAAKRMFKNHTFYNNTVQTLVTGHSLGASRALAYKHLFKPEYCVLFNPPPTWRKGILQPLWGNTVAFHDPDDPVYYAGQSQFEQPTCKTFMADNNYFGLNVFDHKIEKWEPFIEAM